MQVLSLLLLIDSYLIELTENLCRSTVHVVLPVTLGLNINPKQFPEHSLRSSANALWYLISGNSYELDVEVYDKENHKLYNTQSLYFQTVLNKTHFTAVTSSSNNGQHNFTADKERTVTIHASMDAKPFKIGQNTIEVEQQVVIQSPVQIVPNKVVTLPFSSNAAKHQYNLRATGGSGEYNWYAANSSVVTVSINGVVTAHNVGSTQVTAVCKKNPLNKHSITLRVQVYFTLNSIL
jgi:nuclear pore complex protein Nup210